MTCHSGIRPILSILTQLRLGEKARSIESLGLISLILESDRVILWYVGISSAPSDRGY